MKVGKLALAVAALALLAGQSHADWDPGDPYKMHYPQLPDLSPLGLDVLDGLRVVGVPQQYEKFLADDWLCTGTGPVTDIHLWGSYNFDSRPPAPILGDEHFSLVIYDNVPAGVDGPYSHPGSVVWDSYRKPTATRLYATASEQFYDPNQNAIIGTDTQVWQFNFIIPEAEAFRQTAGQIYWLGVHYSADTNGDGIVDLFDLSLLANNHLEYGWKTSGSPHFEDDAVWRDVTTFGGNPHVVPLGGWNELRRFGDGESLDLAFVITGVPEPSSVVLMVLGGLSMVALALKRRRG